MPRAFARGLKPSLSGLRATSTSHNNWRGDASRCCNRRGTGRPTAKDERLAADKENAEGAAGGKTAAKPAKKSAAKPRARRPPTVQQQDAGVTASATDGETDARPSAARDFDLAAVLGVGDFDELDALFDALTSRVSPSRCRDMWGDQG